jgi:GNAT superfamily N-acetyltransferase
LIIRPATRDDIEAFASIKQWPSLLAVAGEIDGRIVLLGGLAFMRGRWFAFCELTDEARQHKIAIGRAAKRIFAKAKERGIRFIYAEADPEEPGAVRWLTSLGFTLDPRSGYLYRWES